MDVGLLYLSFDSSTLLLFAIVVILLFYFFTPRGVYYCFFGSLLSSTFFALTYVNRVFYRLGSKGRTSDAAFAKSSSRLPLLSVV